MKFSDIKDLINDALQTLGIVFLILIMISFFDLNIVLEGFKDIYFRSTVIVYLIARPTVQYCIRRKK